MKKSSMILGFAGSSLAAIFSGFSILTFSNSIPTPGMGSYMESFYLLSAILSILSALGAVTGILGSIIVMKRPKGGGVLMLCAAVGSVLSGFGIIASIFLIIGGIMAVIHKEKAETKTVQIPDVEAKRGGAGSLALGITLGAVLLIVSSIIVSLAYFSEFTIPPDTPQYDEYMKDLVTLTPYDTQYIVLGAIGTLGGLACLISASAVKKSLLCSGRRLGFVGSSIALFTVAWVLMNGRVLMTYPEVTALEYMTAAVPCTIAGFLGSAFAKKKNILAGILLIAAAAGLLIDFSVQTMVFIGAASVLLLLGSIFAFVPENRPEQLKEENI